MHCTGRQVTNLGNPTDTDTIIDSVFSDTKKESALLGC